MLFMTLIRNILLFIWKLMNDTKYEINDIFPNTTYNLSFKYTYLEDGEVHTDTFDNITVTTKRPKVNIKTTSVEGGNIKYLVTSESNFKFR